MIFFYTGRTKVCFHFSFFAVVCIFLQYSCQKWGLYWLTAVLLHEAGHIAAFALQKIFPKELHFQFSGIRLVPPDEPVSFAGELFILLGGAASSFLFSIVFRQAGCTDGALFHLVTGIFSLLPVQGLDGGETVFLLMERLFPRKGRTAAAFITAFSGCILALGMIAAGIRLRSPSFFLPGLFFLLSVMPERKTCNIP